MSDLAWGLPEREADPPPARRPVAEGRSGKGLSPRASAAAHKGIVWLHLAAILLWLGLAAVLGVVGATGREIPSVVFVACVGAAAGHGLFLGLHSYFASAARRRSATPTAG